MTSTAVVYSDQPNLADRANKDLGKVDTDQQLKSRILNYLHQRHVAALRRVEVRVQEGVVSITGLVNTFYEKQLCLSCCQRVAGVIRIEDGIDVA